jgi:predicted transcriptional regulator
MKYRCNIEVMGQILQVANCSSNDATKTKIMYQAFLSYNQLEEHLSFLIRKGLLNYDANTRTFRTTEKGIQFLEAYNLLEDMIKYDEPDNGNNNEHIKSDKEGIKQISKE